ncbi:hypothetical protein GC105_09250 [Alkalibaculum sp. M08DMB]|uniref:Uncharacterized protein n=1 Tax=Alkalibaculum sporogenes TaxID=2655001 RepID=A0A6A7K9A3_9FIRM|nr:hypothetical protein [Alkalibaculum sporogenes]MPW25976.1 hypothetical protein [Alkalibaculum sporogenes]
MSTIVNSDISINASEINQHDLNNLSHPLIQIIADYFKQPGVQEKYEVWLKERESRKGGNPDDN